MAGVRVVTSEIRRVVTFEMRGFLGSGGGDSSRAPFFVGSSRAWSKKSGDFEGSLGFGVDCGGRFVPVMYFEANIALLWGRGLERTEEGGKGDTLFDRLDRQRQS